jgi:hypothetical protein
MIVVLGVIVAPGQFAALRFFPARQIFPRAPYPYCKCEYPQTNIQQSQPCKELLRNIASICTVDALTFDVRKYHTVIDQSHV